MAAQQRQQHNFQPGQIRTTVGQMVVTQRPPATRPMVLHGNQVRAASPVVSAARPPQASTISQSGRNVVINQPGARPGAPGSQITVPLTTLQGLQPGQGISTGQPGHLLVKTENGQYQILKVGSSATGPGAPPTAQQAAMRPGQPVSTALRGATPAPAPQPRQVVPSMPTRPVVQSSATPTRPSTVVSSAAAPMPQAASPGGVSTAGMGQQMAPDTAKLKCKNFLATLLRLARDQPPQTAKNVRNLIQGLIDGNVEPESFTLRLQKELNSSPQPCLVPFLKKSLPFLQQSLRNREMTIEGVRPPPMSQPTSSMGGPTIPQHIVRPRAAATQNLVQRPNQQAVPQVRAMGPQGMVRPNLRQPSPMPGMMADLQRLQMQQQNRMPTMPGLSTARPVGLPTTPTRNPAMPSMSSFQSPVPGPSPSGAMRSEKKSSTFSTAGDEDINDVAAMGGVNLHEESQRMQGSTDLIGTQIRSCKDETFLQTGLLNKRIAKICRDRGLEEPSSEVIALVSHATQDRLKTLLEKLSIIAEHRMDIIKLEGDNYEVTQDVKGQIKFLSDLDKLEKRRHEEAERDLLIRAAKTRTKPGDDPEKEKLKARAKELQRLEEEQMRQEKANNTALLAIGGPKKKLRLDESGMAAFAGGKNPSAALTRPKTKRVHQRDLMFLMEQEKSLKRSTTLWKAYVS